VPKPPTTDNRTGLSSVAASPPTSAPGFHPHALELEHLVEQAEVVIVVRGAEASMSTNN